MKKNIWLFSLIAFIGIILRIYKLGYHDLWYDEALSALLAQHLKFTSFDPQAPLYNFILSVLDKFTTLNEFILRVPSFIFGFLSILGIYYLGKLLFGRNVGIWSAILLTISPLHIWYSQEARAYTAAIFLVILSSYFFIRSIKDNNLKFWMLFFITQVVGVYANYLFWLWFIPQVAIIYFFRNKINNFKKLALVFAGVFLIYLPWLSIFFTKLQSFLDEFWIAKPTLFSFYTLFCNLNLGYTAAPKIFFVSFFLFGSILVWGIYIGSRKYKNSTLTGLCFLILPVIITFIISKRNSFFISRQLSMVLPFYLILIGLGISCTKKRFIKVLAVTAILFLTTISLVNYYLDVIPSGVDYHVGTYIKKPIQPITDYIERNFKRGDIIAFSNPQYFYPFIYYLGKKYNYYYFFIPSAQDKYWRKVLQSLKDSKYKKRCKNITDLTSEYYKIKSINRIWLISSSWPRDGTLDENSIAVGRWIERDYKPLDERWMYGTLVELYAKE